MTSRYEIKPTYMNIRTEPPADFHEVENLTREAFWNVYAPAAWSTSCFITTATTPTS